MGMATRRDRPVWRGLGVGTSAIWLGAGSENNRGCFDCVADAHQLRSAKQIFGLGISDEGLSSTLTAARASSPEWSLTNEMGTLDKP